MSLCYFTIYAPSLRLKGESVSSELSQILFYTSRARTVTQNAMLRQIGIAKGLSDFAGQFSSSGWLSVVSSRRTLVQVCVQPGLWAHAAIDGHVDAAWVESSILAAWRDWRLLHGRPSGRKAWERSLEKYFSVWVWSWDLAAPQRLLQETLGGVPAAPDPPPELGKLVSRLAEDREVSILHDQLLLHAEHGKEPLTPLDRTDVLRRVVAHLSGLERERQLVRAAAKKPGAIREKSSKSSSSSSKPPSTRVQQDPQRKSTWQGVLATLGKGIGAKQDDSPANSYGALSQMEQPSSGPFQTLQQKLTEPIHEAGGRVWSGAESAWKALGLSGPSWEPSSAADTTIPPQQGRRDSAVVETNVDADQLAEAINDTHTPEVKAFPSMPVTSAAWYTSKTTEPASQPAETHHNFELDGWGDEEPIPFQTFRCFVGGGEQEFTLEEEEEEEEEEGEVAMAQMEVAFTTRRLLTLMVISRVEQGSQDLLEPGWELLRRVQRVLNDYERLSKPSEAGQYLHLDTDTLTYQTTLSGDESEGHCLSALSVMKRHGIKESLARSNDGKTWTAAREGHTFMVLPGRKVSIVDCDNELRRLANDHPEFGI